MEAIHYLSAATLARRIRELQRRRRAIAESAASCR